MATNSRDPLERASHRKDLIEMERRHIREGETRVARQEEIVIQLDSSGAPEHALTARALLVTFREFLAFAKQPLDDLEREQPNEPACVNRSSREHPLDRDRNEFQPGYRSACLGSLKYLWARSRSPPSLRPLARQPHDDATLFLS
jgi:hypothetical protein